MEAVSAGDGDACAAIRRYWVNKFHVSAASTRPWIGFAGEYLGALRRARSALHQGQEIHCCRAGRRSHARWQKARQGGACSQQRLNTAYVLKESSRRCGAASARAGRDASSENWRQPRSGGKPWQRVRRRWSIVAAGWDRSLLPASKVSLGFVEELQQQIRVVQRRAAACWQRISQTRSHLHAPALCFAAFDEGSGCRRANQCRGFAFAVIAANGGAIASLDMMDKASALIHIPAATTKQPALILRWVKASTRLHGNGANILRKR